MISPPTNGYVGFSGAEAPTLNPDLNVDAPSGVQAAIDGSGNLWVLNNDTNGGYYDADYNIVSNPGNVLVEYVGLAAPVVTPSALAQSNGQLATRP
jgi:type 1 fimbria pilin